MNIINRIKRKLKIIKVYNKIKTQLKEDKTKRVILAGTPLHGNLGDHAICRAEIEFMKNYFPQYQIIEVPSNIIREKIFSLLNLKKYIKDTDCIFINGGGFLGTLWIYEENMSRIVLDNFNSNNIIIMPQTIFFEQSTYGKEELEKSKKLYNNTKNLTICCREKLSYDFAKLKFFNNRIELIPDMVLYLKYKKESDKRDGILFCLRKDKEKVLSDEQQALMEQIVRKYENNLKYTDTVVNYNIYEERRKFELSKKLEEFASSKIVITDRLHGMIFASITGTPCIIMDNCSKKVSNVYQWIKNNEYILYMQDFKDFEVILKKAFELGDCVFDNKHLKPEYDKLAEIIKENLN